jgi:hypothetical protein
MFRRTVTKLEDARIHLDQLKKASDAPTFRAEFNAFLSAARAITNTLQKECRGKIKGFDSWYTPKQEEMKNDNLLRFIHEARIEDFHKGRHRLKFKFAVHKVSFPPEDEEPPSEDAVPALLGDGVFWIVDRGTPRERRIPAKTQGGIVSVAIANPPTTHLDKKLQSGDPRIFCELALEYYENLVHEAWTYFETR